MKSNISSEDDLELLEGLLFRSLSEDKPSAEARQLVAAGLGLATTGIIQAASANAPVMTHYASSIAKLVVAKWIGVGVVAGTVSLGAARYAPTLLSTRTPSRPAAVAPPSSAKTIGRATSSGRDSISTSAPPEPAIEEKASAVSPFESPNHGSRRSASPRLFDVERGLKTRSAEPVAAPPSMLAAEIATLDRTRAAISSRDVFLARRLLDEYARQFPRGTLKLESTVLLVETLFLQGQSEPAVALAHDVLREHGSSTHASRVRYLLSRYAKR